MFLFWIVDPAVWERFWKNWGRIWNLRSEIGEVSFGFFFGLRSGVVGEEGGATAVGRPPPSSPTGLVVSVTEKKKRVTEQLWFLSWRERKEVSKWRSLSQALLLYGGGSVCVEAKWPLQMAPCVGWPLSQPGDAVRIPPPYDGAPAQALHLICWLDQVPRSSGPDTSTRGQPLTRL